MSNQTARESTIERCVTCGMIANLDPSLHHQRYRHLPRVRRNGKLLQFDYRTYAFTREIR